ncbi:transcriptional regulator [Sphingorhabdus sp. M41]|uniref:transcriptional regulator n=1 Tax=Sphingorhabdus sp. M41 TaxID=1806885 RepID=UPI00078B29A6|nr:transcriptional regulator [Sphingorhabdus sp. M41]AMO72298.1 transcriptional regulator [Sphingorhabdus sp. M41]
MNGISGSEPFRQQVFGEQSRQQFARCYPEQAQVLDHQMASNEWLTLEALARLGEALPGASVEYNPGDLPVGIKPENVPSNGLTIGDTIRTIDQSASWAVLKNIEQVPEYEALLLSLLAEIRPILEAKTGQMLKPQGFIFVSSPGAVTPYHFDPEHNILLQLRGEKWMTTFPAGNARFAADEIHEGYHLGGHRNLVWEDDFAAEGTRHHLTPGKAIFVPVMAPHFVQNGPEPSISLSITWRSDWSFEEADARAFNGWLRKRGITPRAPGRFPARNRVKAFAWRVLRKISGR